MEEHLLGKGMTALVTMAVIGFGFSAVMFYWLCYR